MRFDDFFPELRILTVKQVAELIGYCEQHIYRMERAGKFPRLRQVGENRVGFLYIEIKAWVLARQLVTRQHDDSGAHARPA